METFHITVHPAPPDTSVDIGLAVQGLMLAPTFEHAVDQLQTLPRLFIEPDGSFVWVGNSPSAWQIDGQLFDGLGRLAYVELKGTCPAAQFDRLMIIFGGDEAPLVVQQIREGKWLSEGEFRRLTFPPLHNIQ